MSDTVEPGFALGQRFELERPLGRGATGGVWQARDTQEGDRRVAIKIFDAHHAEILRYWERFEREASVLQRLEHPGLVRLLAVDRIQNRAYLVMELVNGIPLQDYLRKETSPDVPLDMMQAVSFFADACDALTYAHGQGVIHRDIKPENLMVEGQPTPRIRLLDFGLAKLLADESDYTTTVGRIIGTPAYMAPEQFLKKPPVPQTDVFALGCVLFELLTKRRMFIRDPDNHPSARSEDAQAPWNRPERVMRRILSEPHPNVREFRPEVPDTLSEVIKKSLSILPDERFCGPDALLTAVRAAMAADSSPQGPLVAPAPPSVAPPIEQTLSLSEAAALVNESEPPALATEVLRDGLKQKAGAAPRDTAAKAKKSAPKTWDPEGATMPEELPSDADLTKVNPQPLSPPAPTVIPTVAVPPNPPSKTPEAGPTQLVSRPRLLGSLVRRQTRFSPWIAIAFVIVFFMGWGMSRLRMSPSEPSRASREVRPAVAPSPSPSTVGTPTAAPLPPETKAKTTPTVKGKLPKVKPRVDPDSETTSQKPARDRTPRARSLARQDPTSTPPTSPRVKKPASLTPRLDALLTRIKANPENASLAGELSGQILERARKLPDTPVKRTIIRQATTSGISGDIEGLEESLTRLRKALANSGA